MTNRIVLQMLVTSLVILNIYGFDMRSLRCTKLLDEATYKEDTLYDLTYKRDCVPEGWKTFFNRVRPMVKVISDSLKKQTDECLSISPKIGWVFRAFQMVPLEKVKVVIIGQDPAPEPGLATGLAFSLKPEVPSYEVPSVQRVVLEARNEGYCVNDTKGNLIPWVKQGVLLLNTALTLIENEIGSHIDMWENFTDAAVSYINANAKPSVWLLWGYHAKSFLYDHKIDTERHHVITGGHPSPKAEGAKFFCRNYFGCANGWLKQQGRKQVDWNLAPVPCEEYESYIYGRMYDYPGYYEDVPCTMYVCSFDK